MTDFADLAKLKVEDFSSLQNRAFVLTVPHGAMMPLKLVMVAPNGETLPPGTQSPTGQAVPARAGGGFLLDFTGPEIHAQPQGTYRLHHPDLGELQMFLVPSSRMAGLVHYRAVFA